MNIEMSFQNEQNNLYPIRYKDKEYYEDDCDEVFTAFYNSPFALNNDCGVYVAEGLWVYPDGEMDEY